MQHLLTLLALQTNPDILASLPAESEFTLSYVLASANRQYCLKLQNNANLVLFTAAGNVLFSSATGGSLGTSLHLRSDGNLMLRASTGAVIWQTRKWNATAGPYNLVLGGDGKLEIKGKNGYILWSRADGGFLVGSRR